MYITNCVATIIVIIIIIVIVRIKINLIALKLTVSFISWAFDGAEWAKNTEYYNG